MTDEKETIKAAKKCLKSHIKFLESLLQHIKGTDEVYKARALWTAWCINRYMNEHLMNELKQEMKNQGVLSER